MLCRRSLWIAVAGIAMVVAVVTVIAFTAVSEAPATRRADKIERVPKSATDPLGYVAFLPPSYTTDADVPTIIYLHGLGERGSGSASDLNILLTAGLPRLAATNKLPADAAQFLILAPQSNDEYFDVDQLHTWLAHVLPSYRVDRTRLYLTGISMGGQGVFDYLAKFGAEQEFAAAVPISGNYLPPPLGVPPCASLARTPLWAFVGERDDVIPPQGSIQVVSYVNKHCHPPEPLRLTVYLDSFHNVWDRTYNLSGIGQPTSSRWEASDQSIYSWLLRHHGDSQKPATG